MDKNRSLTTSLPQSAKKLRTGTVLFAGIFMLVAAASVYLVLHRAASSRDMAHPEAKTKDPVAELVSATGMVLAGKTGRREWNQVAAGARLMEGDLIKTEKAGAASIRYSNGNTVTIRERTVLTVRSAGDGSIEPNGSGSVSVFADSENEVLSSEPADPENRGAVDAFNEARANEPGPFIRLDRIVPFGRILELVGNVDAGSRMSVNKEIVEVDGDGSFKHFTNPFPASEQKANLVMKVTDLAGRTRVVAAVHNFNPRSRDQ